MACFCGGLQQFFAARRVKASSPPALGGYPVVEDFVEEFVEGF
jgi:hypothetical protein